MNLLLLDPGEVHDARATITGRRARHLLQVLRVRPGDRLRAGICRGPRGAAEVTGIDCETHGASPRVSLRLHLETPPSPRPGCDLVLALPRPKVLRRLLGVLGSVGLGRLDLVNTWRVERSYFQSPALAPEALEAALRRGAEQGATTWIPEVAVHRLLMPYLEETWPEAGPCSLAQDAPEGAPRTLLLVAHPRAAQPIEAVLQREAARRQVGRALPQDALLQTEPKPRVVVAVGPEGGFIEQEVATLHARGFAPVHLGAPVLSVEAAVPWLLAKLDAILGLWQSDALAAPRQTLSPEHPEPGNLAKPGRNGPLPT